MSTFQKLEDFYDFINNPPENERDREDERNAEGDELQDYYQDLELEDE